jgi:hypothetical protein
MRYSLSAVPNNWPQRPKCEHARQQHHAPQLHSAGLLGRVKVVFSLWG